MKTPSLIAFAALTVFLGACASRSSAPLEGSVAEVREGEARAIASQEYLGLGAPGLRFRDEVTVFVSASDAQPRCRDCRTVRIIADVFHPNSLGEASAVRVNSEVACAASAVPAPNVSLSSIYRTPHSAHLSGPITLSLNGCDPAQDLTIEILAPRCPNRRQPECNELEPKATISVRAADLLALTPRNVATGNFPNQKTSRPGEDKHEMTEAAQRVGALLKEWKDVASVQPGLCGHKWVEKALNTPPTPEVERFAPGVRVAFRTTESLQAFAHAAAVFGNRFPRNDALVCAFHANEAPPVPPTRPQRN